MSTPSYGFGDKSQDAKIEFMRQYLTQWVSFIEEQQKKVLGADNDEAIEIYREGVRAFHGASDGCAPLQKFMVGLRYTLDAIEEWKRVGPIAGAPPTNTTMRQE